MRYSISGGMSYQDAARLVNEFKNAGIDANTTAGGIDIFPEAEQISKMNEIAKGHGRTPQEGTTDAKQIGAIRRKQA